MPGTALATTGASPLAGERVEPMWRLLRVVFSRKKGCRVCGEPVTTPDGLFCSERHAEDYRYQNQYGW